jgi:hypothetical protein
MKTAKIILAGTAALITISSAAWAQQALTGTVTKVDRIHRTVAIQKSGAIGANTGGAAEEFKAQDGIFCSLNLFRNRLHHIVDRSCARDRQLHVLDESLVVFGKSLQRCLGFHLNNLVAAGLQAAKQ